MRRGRRPWLALLAVVLTVVLDVVGGACLPLLARDPRVTKGVSARLSAALPVRSHPDSVTGGVPLPDPLAASLSYGWSKDLNRYPAFELTLSAPFGLVFIPQPEAYIQLPRSLTGSLGVGAGAAYSWFTKTALPYIEVGLLDQRGAGPVMMAAYSNRAYPAYPISRTADHGSVLTATFGYQFSTVGGTGQLFLEGVFARRDPSCDINFPCTPSTRSWLAAAGVSHGFTLPRQR